MIDTPIITLSELQKYKQISASGNDSKLNQLILEAQFQDLRPLMGERLFNAVLKDVKDTSNTNGTTYTKLLNGGEYVCNGVTFYQAGLKAVLANYVYGRKVMWGGVVDNPFGATIKLNRNSSEPVDYATRKSFYNENKDLAFNVWLSVSRYLARTKEPLFISKCSKKRRSFNLRKIG